MASDDILEIAHALVRAPSPSGKEEPALLVAEERLRAAGMETVRQPVGRRWNLLASRGRPRALLTTHLDTVPDSIPVGVEGDTLYGRGACDAKGIAAAMIAAAADLCSRDRSDFGLLLLVGEETTSDGAIRADEALASGELDWPVRWSLLGEPTGNRWVTAHPGVLIVTVRARGRSAHSAHPEEGDSAIHRLLPFLEKVRAGAWPEDPALGPTLVNVGTIRGGTAANVIAGKAEAQVMFRSGGDPAEIEEEVRRMAGDAVDMDVACVSPPIHFAVPTEDEEAAGPVSFSTDAPFLPHFGVPSLLGPGSVRLAHTDGERITRGEMERARDLYVSWIEGRLAGEAAR